MKVRLSSALSLPLEIVGEANAVIGKRGSGKTTTAKKLVEGMLAARQHVVIVEPTDVWYGLRSSADGKGPGFGVAVFGGAHADLPLEAEAGAYMADLLVGERLSAVLCLKPFNKTQRRRFMADFAERLLQINTDLLHVVLEEAHHWIPQRPQQGDQRMLGACSDLTTTGRTGGIGTTLVSQRPARMHKDPFEQTDNLVVCQLVGANDRKAVADWVKANELSTEAAAMLDALPKLKQGNAYVYAPALLGEPVAVQVEMTTTFDSQATPKPGQSRREPKTLADVNLDAVREAMGEAIERAQASDPKHLQKRIAELERELQAGTDHGQQVAELEAGYTRALEHIAELEKRPMIDPELLHAAREWAAEAKAAVDEGVARWERVTTRLAQSVAQFSEHVAKLLEAIDHQAKPSPTPVPLTQVLAGARHHVPRDVIEADDLTGPQQRVVDACAWLHTLGVQNPTRMQVALVAGYHPRTKGFTNALGSLRSAGLVEYPRDGQVRLVEFNLANVAQQKPTVTELQAMICEQVGPSKARILRVLIEAYPSPVTREELAEQLDYHPRTKGFTNALGSLRTLGVIEYPSPGSVVASPLVFGAQA